MSSCAVAVVVVRRIYAARKNPPHKIQVVGQPICEDEALAPDIPSHVSQVLVHVMSPSSWYKVAVVRIRHVMVQVVSSHVATSWYKQAIVNMSAYVWFERRVAKTKLGR